MGPILLDPPCTTAPSNQNMSRLQYRLLPHLQLPPLQANSASFLPVGLHSRSRSSAAAVTQHSLNPAQRTCSQTHTMDATDVARRHTLGHTKAQPRVVQVTTACQHQHSCVCTWGVCHCVWLQ